MNENTTIQETEVLTPEIVPDDPEKALTVIKQTQAPKGIPADEIEKAEAQANQIALSITDNPENRSAVREAARLGEDIQTKANHNFKLMRTSLGQVMEKIAESGQSSSIPKDLKALRNIMEEINPYSAIEQMKRGQNAGFFSKLFGRIPGVGKILKDIAQKYESVQTQVDVIIQSLEAGADKLLENSIEIEERYNHLKQLQNHLKIRGYQLAIIVNKLEDARLELTEPMQQQALQKAMAKCIRRLQNIKITENAFSQFFITMNVTMDNHENLRDAVQSMTNLTRPVLENGLALKIAQQEERDIAKALEASQDYLGNLMTSIAQDTMDNAALTAEVVNSPLIKLHDLTKSYQILMSRMQEASEIEARMMMSAKQNIAQLEHMTEELEKHAEAQEAGRESVRDV